MIKAIFARSPFINRFDHEYQMIINKVKKSIRTGKVRINRGISFEQAVAGTADKQIQSYVAESRSAYITKYARDTHGVTVVTQDW